MRIYKITIIFFFVKKMKITIFLFIIIITAILFILNIIKDECIYFFIYLKYLYNPIKYKSKPIIITHIIEININ